MATKFTIQRRNVVGGAYVHVSSEGTIEFAGGEATDKSPNERYYGVGETIRFRFIRAHSVSEWLDCGVVTGKSFGMASDGGYTTPFLFGDDHVQ